MRPMRFAIGPPNRQKKPIRPKTKALAALTKNGFCAPPAPSEFIAFQRPGAMKPTIPMTHALNMLDRYHFLVSVVVCSSWLSARSELVEADIFATGECEEMQYNRTKSHTYLMLLVLYTSSVMLHVYAALKNSHVRYDCAICRQREYPLCLTADNLKRAQATVEYMGIGRCLGNCIVCQRVERGDRRKMGQIGWSTCQERWCDLPRESFLSFLANRSSCEKMWW